MTKKMYCQCCGKQFFAQRSTAKYCSGTCRARWSREKKSDLEREIVGAYANVHSIMSQYFNDDHDPELQTETLTTILNIQHELNKMIAVIGMIESYQANTWYQCADCGQRTFGKVETCDFCGGHDFRVVAKSQK